MAKRSKRRVPSPPKAPARPAFSRRTLLLAGGGAVVVAAVLIAVSVFSGSGNNGSSPPLITTGASSAIEGNPKLLAGIPQQGLVLGSPKARVTLVEYADLQCPYCGDFSNGTLPALLDEYVRPGKVKIEFRGLKFVGPDSEKALRAVLSAAQQNKGWTMLELLYANQGEENKGWVTDDLIGRIAAAIPGLDVAKLTAGMDASLLDEQMREMDVEAQADGVRGTPTFTVGRADLPPTPIELGSLDIAAFRPALDAALAK